MTTNKYGLDLQIADLWYIPFWKTNFFYGILSFSFILIFILALYCFYKSRKKIKKDPVLLLLADLNNYHERINQIDSQIFYFDLISKYKEFIGYKYNLNLINTTDLELKSCLNISQEIDHDLVVILLEILDFSYFARFAKNEVNRLKMESHLQHTINAMQLIISKNSL